MCIVSDKLKLCSCTPEDVTKLKHYWILKRSNGEDMSIVGESLFPFPLDEEANKLNVQTLSTMLNEGNCFDVELQHKKDDILELYFTTELSTPKELTNKNYIQMSYHEKFIVYTFKYGKNKWEVAEWDSFSNNLDEIQKGEINNAFKK